MVVVCCSCLGFCLFVLSSLGFFATSMNLSGVLLLQGQFYMVLLSGVLDVPSLKMLGTFLMLGTFRRCESGGFPSQS